MEAHSLAKTYRSAGPMPRPGAVFRVRVPEGQENDSLNK
jgi:hypothetical protein